MISTVSWPLRAAISPMAEHLVGLLRRQHRGRLVQDHQEAAGADTALRRISSFCFSPAASSTTRASGQRERRIAMNSSTAIGAFAPPVDEGTGSALRDHRFSATVMPGTTREVLEDHADAQCRGVARAADLALSRPSTITAAGVGGRNRSAHFTSVDLPAPFSPSSAWNEPASTSSTRPVSGAATPKRLVKPRFSSDCQRRRWPPLWRNRIAHRRRRPSPPGSAPTWPRPRRTRRLHRHHLQRRRVVFRGQWRRCNR